MHNEDDRQLGEVSAAARRALVEGTAEQKAGSHRTSPLSFAQEQLWFLDELERESTAYNEARALRLVGRLDVAAVKQSLCEIARRHETLRTTFAAIDGRPVQIISPSLTLSIPLVDLSCLPQMERKAQVGQLLVTEAQRSFDLVNGPLFRVCLFQLDDCEHVLLVSAHHIVVDGWSLRVLIQELTLCYRAFVDVTPLNLPPLLLQYSDFAIWQRRWLQGEVLEELLGYWEEQLADLTVLQLPTDHPRRPAQTFRGATQTFEFPAELVDGLKALGRRVRITPFVVLLAAFNVLLYRYTGQKDIVVGSPVAGRSRAELENLVGFFVNMLVLRSNAEGAPSFLEFLARVQDVVVGAYEHQSLPFSLLAQRLQTKRDLSRNPLFQVVFAQESAPAEALELPGLTIEPFAVENMGAKVDLVLSIAEVEEGIRGTVQYNTDLFDAATVLRMIGHFRTVAQGIVADPEKRISDLPILTSDESLRVLDEWNRTATIFDCDRCVHQIFEACVEQMPEKVAVTAENRATGLSEHLTYAALNRRANRLARYLRKLGVAPEVKVGICVKRSLEMVVGLLGIWKAGGAYVPLDSAYPRERLAFVLEDSGIAVLLTQSEMGELVSGHDVRCVYLDTEWIEVDQESGENLFCETATQNLAYVIYTSGSTGKPKGVRIEHRGLLNLVYWHSQAFDISADDRATQIAGAAFDASVWELWPYLALGASIHVVDDETRVLSSDLRDWLVAQKVTISFLPTPLAEMLLSLEWPQNLALRTMLTGGEKLHSYPASSLPFTVVNNYGPTEDTVVTTSGRVPPGDARRVAPSIGRPIANAQIYLLDPQLQPVPIGVPGELCVGGNGLARDYLGRPGLTADKFMPNPFSDRPGARMYMTGDLARYLPSGEIEFLGRRDHQVKVRGFRIELGEIEAVLAQCPTVQDVVVVTWEDEDLPAEKRLVAYVVAQDGQKLVVDDLRHFLRERLPDYMVPSAFVLLEALPLTPNGKVDRRALPVPEEGYPQLESAYIEPRNEIERKIAAIWQDVLGGVQVGIQDNFFEMGGHSLLATRVISRVRDVLQIELPLRLMFELATVAGLARWIEGQRQSEREPSTFPLERVSREGDLALSFSQQRLWFLHQLEPESTAYNVPAALRLSGYLDVRMLERSLNEVVERHESLRTRFEAVAGQPVQVIVPRLVLPLWNVDLRGGAEAEREAELQRLVAGEARRTFDLGQGPLVRVTVIRMAEREYVLLLTMHHIVSDAWSIGLLVQEMAVLYDAFMAGEDSPLSKLPIQYVDYAMWQREWLRGDVLERQLSYWKEKLSDAPPMLELPTDRPRPSMQSYKGDSLAFTLPESLVSALKKLSQEAEATLFMTLLAAFEVLLYRLTGQKDLVVGTPIAGRNRAEVEGLIGFFVNTLVLRVDCTNSESSHGSSGAPSFQEILGRVRNVALEAYAHQDVPFEMLVNELHPERDLSRSPLFQVMFVLQNAPMEMLELTGLEIDLLPVDIKTAKFDLTLSVAEVGSEIVGEMEYSTDLFDASTVERIIGHFRTLLEGVTADPDQRICDLPLLTEAEQWQIVREWNDTRVEYPRGRCVRDLFEEQVEQAPDAVAVVFEGGEHITYKVLNRRANQVARYLQDLGVGPEALVGICVERSVEMVVGLLGILKAGGAYVPLDPAYPRDRLAFILKDSDIAILLTHSEMRDVMSGHDVQAVYLDAEWTEIGCKSGENLLCEIAAQDLAYVIYTSGSTGKPKGVLVTHRGLPNVSAVQREMFGVEASDRVLQFSSLNFDASTFEIVMALGSGATLCLGARETLLPGSRLARVLRDWGITIFTLTPSTLLVLPVSDLAALRTVTVAGEACPAELVPRWKEGRRFFNLYGPTETTIWATAAECIDGEQRPPIGRPIANTRVYVLDENLTPVPIGVAGELCIGGDALARGYLNRPGLTAERFVPNPYVSAEDGGERLYRTGDLVRYLSDGNLEFLGRIDHQVKVRGFRIELGEIEAVLAQYPVVQDVVVVAREDEGQLAGKRLVAYVVAQDRQKLVVDDLRHFLRERLPDYMVPSAFVLLEALPLTPNGKVDRQALPVPEGSRSDIETAYIAPRSNVEHVIAGIWQELLGVERVGIRDNFFDLGGHSLLLVQVHDRLLSEIGCDLSLTDMFRYTTIATLAEYLDPERDQADRVVERVKERSASRLTALRVESSTTDFDLAIVGMAGRFPGADTLDQFWENLYRGVESITFFSDKDLLEADFDPDLINHPNYVKARALVSNIDCFDARFFGMSPGEAEFLDPQHRLFLECAWQALESAGYDPSQYDGRIGVYAGQGANTYLVDNIYPTLDQSNSLKVFQARLGNQNDFLVTLVSYKLNLNGPSFTVQTACSTSLVAVHLACQALLDRECEIVLAGGVSLMVPQIGGYMYEEGGILSPDGHCRPFDAEAQGTVVGGGVGVVAVKRLAEALKDGDTIHAVIKGSAINNDGARKVGYTAPSEDGQVEVVVEALAVADVEPETITYVEAHGTGTELGDPIEVAALTRVFRAGTGARNFCALGSVKSNIGHLDAAAGVAGLIKTVLALEHGQLPPSLHFTEPNPKIDFAASPFYVNTELRDWETNGCPRRAGVSSFGMGGTNAHVVLEEAPAIEAGSSSRPWQLLVLSARSATALETATANLAACLEQNPDLDLADAAYTLQVGRQAFANRRMVVCENLDDAVSLLRGRDPQQVFSGEWSGSDNSVVFMFSGQGSQYVAMGCDLYQSEAVFRKQVDICVELLAPLLGFDLLEVLYPELGEEQTAVEKLNQTALAQPALFVVEYALARLWMAWGVKPVAMIGHSIGEYVAACLAGVFKLEDALALVVERGRLMQSMPPGAMLSVAMSEAEIRARIGGSLAVAAVNGPERCVISGPTEAVAALEKQLIGEKAAVRRLHTSHAFHSSMMESILEPFKERVGQIELQAPQIPYISNVTGTWITQEEAIDPYYWVHHLRQTVRFADGVDLLTQTPDQVLLEIGPGQTLRTLVQRHPDRKAEQVVLSSMRHPREKGNDQAFLLRTLGQLWLAGVAIDWSGFYSGERRKRIPLPTYPFERERYWIEAVGHAERRGNRQSSMWNKSPISENWMFLEKKPNVADWFYVPVWRQSVPVVNANDFEKIYTWLVFCDTCGLSVAVVDRLRQSGQDVVTVAAGDAFQSGGEAEYIINPGCEEDYDTLVKELEREEKIPQRVVHLWSVNLVGSLGLESLERTQDLCFYSLLFLAKALGGRLSVKDCQLTVVSNNVQKVMEEEQLCPERATLLGAVKVIPLEYPNLVCRNLDLDLCGVEVGREGGVEEQILTELKVRTISDVMVACRNGHRWVQVYEPVCLPEVVGASSRLREKGVYLITGGLGAMGLTLAEHLAREVQARLILVGRSALPEQSEWEEWTSTHGENDDISRKLRKVQEIEKTGAKVWAAVADVADLEQMHGVVNEAQKRFGHINGVIHCAGLADYAGVIQNRTKAMTEEVMAPKVRGTLVLDGVLKDSALDFFVVCSSLGSVLYKVKFGQVGYSAACEFLDVFASYNASKNGTFTTCINWDDWQEIGMAVEAAKRLTGDTDLIASAELAHALLPSEGVEIFDRILSQSFPRVVLSTRDLSLVLEGHGSFDMVSSHAGAILPGARHPRPGLNMAYVPPRDEVERIIAACWEEVLGIEQIGVRDSFFELGGDSLLGLRVIAQAKAAGVNITLRQLFQYPTIEDLALDLTTATLEDTGMMVEAEQGIVSGPVPLLPIQYDELCNSDPNLNVSGSLVVMEMEVDPALMQEAWRHLMVHHDALRLRFVQEEPGWRQFIIPPDGDVPFSWIDIDLPEKKRREEIWRVAEELIKSLHLADGPVLRIVLFGYGQPTTDALFVAIHHQILEGVASWRTLLEDLFAVYFQLDQEEPVSLPAKTISFKRVAELWAEHFHSSVVQEELECWIEAMRQARERVLPIPLDYPDGIAAHPVWRWLTKRLSVGETSVLRRKVMATHNVSLVEVLLACFSEAWWRWTGSRRLLFEQVEHARNIPSVGADLSRTIGYLVHHTMVFLDLDEAENPVGALPLVKQQLQGVHPGFGPLLVQYLKQDVELARQILPHCDLNFNYLSHSSDAPLINTPKGPVKTQIYRTGNAGAREIPRSLLYVGGGVNGQELHVGCRYNASLHEESTIDRLMQDWLDALWLLVDSCDEWRPLPDKLRLALRPKILSASPPFDHWGRQLLRRLGKYCRVKP